MTSEDGDTFIIKAGPKHEIIGTNSIGEAVYASPAIADGRIFIRGEKKIEAAQRFTGGTQTLFCYGDVAANLFITGGDEQRLGYTYSLALNWGMSGGYVWNKVDCPQ
jgi:hypothetical protein